MLRKICHFSGTRETSHWTPEKRRCRVDSGCNAQFGQVRLNEVLTGIRDSNTCVRTAVGSDSVFPGDKHGVMNMYTLNLNPEDPSGAGSTVNHAIDTVKGLNGDLFSMSNYYDELQCDMS